MRILIALTLLTTLAGCAETTGVNSRVFNTGDSYGPAGRVGWNGGGGQTARPARTQLAPVTSN